MKQLILPLLAAALCCFTGKDEAITELNQRLPHLLWDGHLPGNFSFDSAGNLAVFAPGSVKPEFRLPAGSLSGASYYFRRPFTTNWSEYLKGSFLPLPPQKINPGSTSDTLPLKGIRIAIDPGHFGGDYATARLERKSVQLKKDSLQGIPKNDTIIEGKLTLITALLLKTKLEKLGATVLLTRSKDNHTAYGKSFEEWWKEDRKKCIDSAFAQGYLSLKEKNTLLKSGSKKFVCREFFLQEDLRERARKINAFEAHLAIIIHFNVDEKNEGWTRTSSRNYTMCFVPGAIFPGALGKKEARFNLLRLMVSDHYPRSVKAAGLICKYFTQILGVPAATAGDAGYLSENCIFTGTPGVFSRNLALTRLPHCPVVYGETLYQDNKKEYSALTLSALRTTPVPPRLEQVADAYLKGIVEYFSN
ncbi:MAG: N-acetylmuramoyl-L-alanine amidase [Bacteroidia bacterium]|nr:N-acetylmuramoyl-L-alanine amidase [Bacteroidia bacterium]